MEEITVDIWTDLGQMYRDPSKFVRFQERLKDIRTVIIHSCQSLFYLEEECMKLGLELHPTSIEQRRRALRAPEHPYNILATYLKPGLPWFHDYSVFYDARQIVGDDETDEWECWSEGDMPVESSSSLTNSSDESLTSDDYILGLGYQPSDEIPSKFDTASNYDNQMWPGVVMGDDRYLSYGDETWDGAIVVVP